MKRYAGVVAGMLLSIVIAGTALAEGNWQSFISNALRGFDSRTWVDRNNDDHGTKIEFSTCRDSVANGAADWATVSLQRMRLFLPAENRGNKTLFCWVTDIENWGDQPESDYQFQLENYSGGGGANNLDVGTVRVFY